MTFALPALLALAALFVPADAAVAIQTLSTASANRTFEARVARYMALRREALDDVGRLKPTHNPDVLVDDTTELRKRLAALREGAREGELLGGSVALSIRTALSERLARQGGKTLLVSCNRGS